MMVCALIALNFTINSQSKLGSNIALANTEALAQSRESVTEEDQASVNNGPCSYEIPTENGFELHFGDFYTCTPWDGRFCYHGCY